jgi:MFS family permease
MEKGSDVRILFLTRGVRTFAYGLLAVVLALFLAQRGFSDAEIGLVFTLTLVGDAVISLGVAGVADRFGRRRLLVVTSFLIVLAGVVFALTRSPIVLTLAAIVGTISPSGAEVGPFMSIEQASISQMVSAADRTRVFGYYQLTGSFSNALGALSGGLIASHTGYRGVLFVYAGLGFILAVLFSQLTSAVEIKAPKHANANANKTGLHRSRRPVLTLSALFAVDSFGSGLAVQTLVAYWLHRRFGADVAQLGGIFFATNVVAGTSALLSAPLAKRIGLVQTMVATHLPGNVLLIAFPFMPSLELSVVVLLGRFLVAQMDVPARTSYMMSIVDEDERSAASAVASQAKLLGASLGPFAAGLMGLSAAPFVAAGVLKIVYDLSLYRLFNRVKPRDTL